MADRHYTVLGNAEVYMTDFDRSRSGGPTRPHRTLGQAQRSLLPQLDRVQQALVAMPAAHRLDEVVVELRLDISRLAKSYHPADLLEEAGLHLRGVGTWQQPLKRDRTVKRAGVVADDDAAGEGAEGRVVTSRSLLVSGSDQAYASLRAVVADATEDSTFERDIIGLEQIRVPGVEDHLALPRTSEPSTAIEIVLYAWDDRRRDRAVTAVETLLGGGNGRPKNDIYVKSYASGPTFIAAVVPTASLTSLGQLNFLRLTRALPRVRLTRTSIGPAIPAPPVAAAAGTAPAAAVAIFDGGFAPLPQFRGLVQSADLTTAAPIAAYVDHGTGVASAAIYGDLVAGQPLPPPRCRVHAYRVLPDPRRNEIDLWGVIDAIEATVPRLPRDVHVINLSLGPEGPIQDVPSRFTYAIDRLSYEYQKLFVTAVGNWGALPDPTLRRIQSPSDAVNALSVGAFTRIKTTAEIVPAPYSSVGPGRPGAVLKPELSHFGGCPNSPFIALLSNPGFMAGTAGTSFASPQVAALTAQLISGRTMSAQAGRALMLHARRQSGSVLLAPGTLEQVLACSPTRVSILYQGYLTPKMSARLPFLLPFAHGLTGNITLSWTIAFCCDIDQGAHEEYTLGGLEVQLRPNANRFKWWEPKDHEPRSEVLHLIDNYPRIRELEGRGWTRGQNPMSDSNRRPTERSLRSDDAKWETIVGGSCGKRGPSLEAPMLTVSFLGRSAWGQKHAAGLVTAPFAAVLTIDAPKHTGDLYEQIAKAHAQLRALAISNQTTVPVTIGRPPSPPKA